MLIKSRAAGTSEKIASTTSCTATAAPPKSTLTIVVQGSGTVALDPSDGPWSGAVNGTVSGNTDGAGEITYTSPQNKSGGTFTFTVDNVEGTGYIYAWEANAETQDSISSP